MAWYTLENHYKHDRKPEQVEINANDLRIIRLPRNEFEKQNKFGAFSDALQATESEGISETKEGNYQKIIGVLICLLKEKRTTPYTNTLIIDELKEKYRNEAGVNQSNLEKVFALAKNL